jgi:hypothetical protein
MADSDIPAGYPDSPPDETTPPGPPISLELADHELEEEDVVEPEGAAPPDSIEREDAFGDAPDADELAALELGNAGARHEDAANFRDNAAAWSRERS